MTETPWIIRFGTREPVYLSEAKALQVFVFDMPIPCRIAFYAQKPHVVILPPIGGDPVEFKSTLDGTLYMTLRQHWVSAAAVSVYYPHMDELD